jgi:hypothetical protein
MTRIVVHIGRIVVHGGAAFRGDDFRESLQQELARRIGGEGGSTELTRKLRAAEHGRGVRNPVQSERAGRTPEQRAAFQVVGRLFR